MKRSTLELHFKLLRHAQGMLVAWQQWCNAEAEESGAVKVERDPDPVAHFNAVNKPKEPRA